MVKEAVIRVVKKNAGGTVAYGAGMHTSRLNWHLDNWACRHRGSTFERGLPKRSVGLSNGGASRDFDEMADEMELRVAEVVDQIIADLRLKSPAAHAALLNRYGIAAVFRFPRNNEAECLARGREYVRAGLEAKGIY